MNSINQLPFKNVLKHPVRTGMLLLMTVFLSFSAFAGTLIIKSLQGGIDSLNSRLGADIIVVPRNAQQGLQSILLQGVPGYFYMDKSVTEKVSKVDGIEKMTSQYFLASIGANCCSMPIQIIGFDPDTDFSVKPWLEKSFNGTLADKQIIVGHKVNAFEGEQLRFYGVVCDVAGKLDETGTELDNAVYCNESTIKTLIKASTEMGVNVLTKADPDTLISSLMIKVKDGYDIQKVADYINVHVKRVEAVKTQSMIEGISDSLERLSFVVSTLVATNWVVVLIMLLITFSMVINERKREFAILRVIGSSKRSLAKTVLFEAVIIGVVGGGLGVLLSSGAVTMFSRAIEKKLGLPLLLPSFEELMCYAGLTVLLCAVVAPVTAALSAYRASKVDAGTVLREE